MRWIWIDTFVEFVPGCRAVAVKDVSPTEEYLLDHFPGYPVVPPSLMIEGMAQTAGILVGEVRGFQENVILAKVKRARFDHYAIPGDQILYDATIESIDARAAVTSGLVFRRGESIGVVDLIFSHVNQAEKGLDLPAHNFVFTEQFKELLATCRRAGLNEESRSR